tara:strand:+ start:68 stop:712 length:645 start_codon:yes stop_codon:yes gene_type:complete
MKKLPSRLNELTQWFLRENVLVDVGCDHGWLPIVSLQNGWVSSAIAVDRAVEPLNLAVKHGKGVSGLQFILSDGLDNVDVPMGTVVNIAGMGGAQMRSILSRSPLSRIQRIVLQPNRDAHLVREYLASMGWYTKAASVVEERGRFFLSWCAEQKKGDMGANRWHWEESWFEQHPSASWKKWLKHRHVQIQRVEEKHGLSLSLKEEKNALKRLGF